MARTDISVPNLVGIIERGELRLPEMQGRYVWRATRVRIDLRSESRAGSCAWIDPSCRHSVGAGRYVGRTR